MPVSTREERRGQRRAEREAAQKKAAQREKVRRYSLLGGGLALDEVRSDIAHSPSS